MRLAARPSQKVGMRPGLPFPARMASTAVMTFDVSALRCFPFESSEVLYPD
jgi:hypothetical protein